jgi:hypothetical protein
MSFFLPSMTFLDGCFLEFCLFHCYWSRFLIAVVEFYVYITRYYLGCRISTANCTRILRNPSKLGYPHAGLMINHVLVYAQAWEGYIL